MNKKNTAQSRSVPKLRFPEFDEYWEKKKLSSIATFTKGKNISKADIIEDGKLECIRYGELYTNYNEIIKEIKSRTNLNQNELLLSEINDVIIPASGETHIDIATASCVLKKGVAIGGDLNIIKSKNDGVFLAYYLNNKKRVDIARLAQGNSVVHLYSSQLKTLNILLPKLAEQQKIASFLTAVDDKIQQLTKKKELLEQYKKGVMQKIFSQEIRFKIKNRAGELVEPPDWEEKKLGEVADTVGGGTPDTNIKKYWNGKIIWLTPTEIKEKYISNSKRKISELGLQKSSAKLLPKGSLLFTSRATIGDVGIAINECSTNQGFQSFIPNSNYNTIFLYNWIIFNKNEFVRKASGSTFLEISRNKIKKIKIKIPSLPEQQKIADFLTAIDKKIDLVNTQLEKTKQFKKGLLQQMFV